MNMKKFLIISLTLLLLPATVAVAQSSKGAKKVESPFVEGRQKVRQTDYDTVWKFTSFDGKTKYFIDYDYTGFIGLPDSWRPELGKFEVVMNYLIRNPRAPMRICAVYAINPNLRDEEQRDALKESARTEALEALEDLQAYMKSKMMKNKLQLQVAQIDYRYWRGDAFFGEEAPADPLIRVGVILYFGTNKMSLFPNAMEGAPTFKAVKFFPNDATVQESWYSHLDEVAKYLKENDRAEVLLTGYTDDQGTAAYSKGLSRQRAVEIKKLLIARGVEEYRIEVEAMGTANPIGDNSTLEGRVANNRCTITLQ